MHLLLPHRDSQAGTGERRGCNIPFMLRERFGLFIERLGLLCRATHLTRYKTAAENLNETFNRAFYDNIRKKRSISRAKKMQ